MLGGARAGKSRFALERAEAYQGRLAFVATAEVSDEEMRVRVERHQAERSERWTTFEEPLALAERLPAIAAGHGAVVVDCLTLWTCNLIFHPEGESDTWVGARFADLVAVLPCLDAPVFFVSNEVGLGIVPGDALSRRYRDHLGRCNQGVAAVADRVSLLVAGIPLTVR